MRVRTQLKAGKRKRMVNHNEALTVRSAVRAGLIVANHNEALRRESERPAISMRRQVPTTVLRKEDRLELLVIRAGLRAGRRARL